MSQTDNPSVLARIGGLILFFAMTAACLVWFVWSSYNLVIQITEFSEIVYFDKGALYMLGASIGLAALTFNILYEGVLRRSLTEKVAKIITRSAIGGIILMFILPQILHYSTNQYLEKKGYNVCAHASYQWLLYRKITYTLNKESCDQLSK